ncbi:hypothetical protein [Embleya sp. AB8]|uniref:hypothetical protein n=1 Tax=Embleya sp. AB8 TaxID=3156304 RepID=UPI003C76228D
MPGAPGQRAAQQPLRAAAATQRALGAAVAPDGGVPARAVGVAMLNGTVFNVDLRLSANKVLSPRKPVERRPEQNPMDSTQEEGGRDGFSADR